MKRTVYLNSDTKVTLLDRRLIEIALPDPEDLRDGEEEAILSYFENHNEVYPHSDLLNGNIGLDSKVEAFFWIPPIEELLEETYNDAPKTVLNAIRAAFVDAKEKGLDDYGYALIGFF
jgi:hypothetical protein